jgi:serine/threonine protein kinase
VSDKESVGDPRVVYSLRMLVVGDRLGGKYTLLQRLGAGGMGEVWLAMQEGSGTFRRRVVVKCLPQERASEERLANMLHDEARILGLLHHPNIVAPLDFIEGEHGPLLVLEQVDGPSLRTALKLARRSGNLLPEPLAAWIGAELARALQAAHAAVDEAGKPLNLVHRDVSPDNVLLSRDGRVRLADFGVASAIGNMDVTNPGSAPKGKRGYMAPEQAAGYPVTPAADQFALGRVVAEAADVLCGTALRNVLDRATATLYADRFPSAQALAEALAEAVPPPSDVQAQLSNWLLSACAEAFATTESGSTPSAPRKPFLLQLGPDSSTTQQPQDAKAITPPRSLAPVLTPPRAPDPQLFATLDDPRPRRFRMIAAVGVVLAILLPVALIFARIEGVHIGAALAAMHTPTGKLRIGSRPDGAEVYVDGKLRGITPLGLSLPSGMHQIRVGSLRLEKWRAADVDVRAGVEKDLEIDLSQ